MHESLFFSSNGFLETSRPLKTLFQADKEVMRVNKEDWAGRKNIDKKTKQKKPQHSTYQRTIRWEEFKVRKNRYAPSIFFVFPTQLLKKERGAVAEKK